MNWLCALLFYAFIKIHHQTYQHSPIPLVNWSECIRGDVIRYRTSERGVSVIVTSLGKGEGGRKMERIPGRDMFIVPNLKLLKATKYPCFQKNCS